MINLIRKPDKDRRMTVHWRQSQNGSYCWFPPPFDSPHRPEYYSAPGWLRFKTPRNFPAPFSFSFHSQEAHPPSCPLFFFFFNMRTYHGWQTSYSPYLPTGESRFYISPVTPFRHVAFHDDTLYLPSSAAFSCDADKIYGFFSVLLIFAQCRAHSLCLLNWFGRPNY